MSDVEWQRAQLTRAIANLRRQIQAAQEMAGRIRMKEGFRAMDNPPATDALWTLLGRLEDALEKLGPAEEE